MRYQTSPYSTSNRPRGGVQQQHQLLALPCYCSGRPAAAYRSRRSDAGPGEVQPFLVRRGREAVGRDLNARQAPIVAGELFPVAPRPLLVVCDGLRAARGGRRARLYVIDAADIAKQIMARLAVALALAAGARAFMAPVTTQPAKTVVYGKGGELRDSTRPVWYPRLVLAAFTPPLHRTMAPAASAAAKLLAQQL